MSEPILLKDQLFHPAKVAGLAQRIQAVYPGFQGQAFIQAVVSGFPERELKARIGWIREQLRLCLPQAYPEALAILLSALPEPCDPHLQDGDFGDFIYAPFGDFVAQYGCQKAYLSLSLAALKAITTRFSAEDAIRPFIKNFPDPTFQALQAWTQDSHYHVRRLVSEGSRPKLPWSQAIPISPEQAFPLLDRLYTDPTRFVTRSVANHLNDWSKSHPEAVIQQLKIWQSQGIQNPTELAFIIRHSLRTLIRQGHPEALALLGIQPVEVQISAWKHSEKVILGESLSFECVLTAHHPVELLIDYQIGFQAAKAGSPLRTKIFKFKKCTLKAGEKLRLAKAHPFQPMTTRKLYPGPHSIALQINGRLYPAQFFQLI